MDGFERVAYVILGLLAAAWAVVVLVGLVAAFPVGLIVLVAIAAFGLLLIKVIKERLANREDDHYDKNVDQ
jgi:hypothetical protein